jgi:phage-related protein
VANIVAVTVRANYSTSDAFSKIRLEAAKAGAQAADAFNDAFRVKASASATSTVKDRLDSTGGIGGSDSGLMSRLKSYANTPGGIGILGTGGDTSLISMLKNQIRSAGENGGLSLLGGANASGNQSASDAIKQSVQGSSPGNVTTEDFIKQVMQGSGPSNVTTDDYIKQILEGTKPGNITTDDIIKQVVEGTKPGNFSTTDTIREVINPADVKAVGEEAGQDYGTSFTSRAEDTVKSGGDGVFRDIESDAGSSGSRSGTSFASSFLKALGSIGGGSGSKKGGGGGGNSGSVLALLGGGGEGESAITSALNTGGVAGGALPGITGISGTAATITGLGASLLGALPAIAAVGAGIGAIGGAFVTLDKTNTKFASDLSSLGKTAESVITSAVKPLTGPLESAMTQLGSFARQIGPELGEMFSAATPLVKPLVSAIEGLVSGLLPGLVAIIKAAAPAFGALSSVIGTLGKDVGGMLSDMAPAIKSSSVIFQALGDVVGALFPVIGKLASIFATSLAPVFSTFAGALKSLLPVFTTIGGVIASFAGAVMGDLVSVLEAAGSAIKAAAPGLDALAKAFGSVFSALENEGVFALFGDVIESIAGPLGKFVGTLAQDLAPVLPVIASAFSKIVGVLASGLGSAIASILPPLAQLAGTVLKSIAGVLPTVAQAFVKVAEALTSKGMISAITTLVTQLADMVAKVAPSIITTIGDAIASIATALATPGMISAITSLVTQLANLVAKVGAQVLGAIATAVGVMAAAIAGIAPSVVSVLAAVVSALADLVSKIPPSVLTAIALGIGAFSAAMAILDVIAEANPFILIGTAIVVVAAIIVKYHTQIWDFIVRIWNDISSFFVGIWGHIENVFTGAGKDISNWAVDTWTALASFFEKTWDDISGGIASAWNAIYSFFRGIWNDIYNWVSSKIDDLRSGMANTWSVIKNDVQGAWNWIYDHMVDPVKNAYSWITTKLSDLGSWMGNKWTSIKSGAQSSWNDLENIFKKPVNFLIGTVYDNGIRTFWNDIMGKIGGPDLPKVSTLASGGLLPGFGGGDRNLALLEDGEAVVDKYTTAKYAPLLKSMGVPGFSGGGLFGSIWNGIKDVTSVGSALLTGNTAALGTDLKKFVGTDATGELATMMTGIPRKIISTAVSSIAGFVKGLAGGGSSSLHPTGSGATIQKLMQSMAASVGWTGTQWTDLNNVEMREAGYNLHATNASSGAYGLAQFINGPSEYAQYGGNVNTAAGQITGMLNYIKQRYGNPGAAWAHEMSAGWYDGGGWLKPGWNMAYNGTGGLEPVGRQMGAGSDGNITFEIGSTGDAAFDALMLKWLRETVRVKGGGRVQAAFGKAGVAA